MYQIFCPPILSPENFGIKSFQADKGPATS